MKLHSGIITDKLVESKEFYTQILDFEIKFESDWFILLNVKESPEYELALMLPEQIQTRKDYFQKKYSSGLWLLLEVKNIQEYFIKLKSKKVKIDLDLTTEEWGDTHFTVLDPNGIGIDILQERTQ